MRTLISVVLVMFMPLMFALQWYFNFFDAFMFLLVIPKQKVGILLIAGLRVDSKYKRSVPSVKIIPVLVKFLILTMFREQSPAPVSFLLTVNPSK